MKIRRAIIKRFGKLADETIEFSDGLNIVYGANESGKSTLYGFIMNMLFGMSRGKGRASITDDFTRFEPKEVSGEYAGRLEFEEDGKDYCLSRDFLAGKRKDVLVSSDGREIFDNANGKLTEMLALSKDIYANTQSLAQDGTMDTKALYGALTDKYSVLDMQSGQDGTVTNSLAILEKKRSKAESALRRLQKQKETEESGLRSNIIYVENEISNIKNQIRQVQTRQAQIMSGEAFAINENGLGKNADEFGQRANDSGRSGEENVQGKGSAGQPAGKNSKAWISAALFIAAVVFALAGYFGLPWGICAAVIFAAAGVLCIALTSSKKSRDTAEHRSELTDEKNGEKTGGNTNENFDAELKYLRESLIKKETDLKKMRDRLNNAGDEAGELEKLKNQVEGLRIAEDTISRIAEKSKTKYDKKFKDAAARIFEYLSADEGRYLAFSDSGELYLSGNDIVVPFWQCSRGTKDLMELSIRLAASEFLEPEQEMPILLDDALIYCDDDRMKRILMFLKNKKRQVILFTCHKREINALNELGVKYNNVRWSGSC